jgi:hypothetical protein
VLVTVTTSVTVMVSGSPVGSRKNRQCAIASIIDYGGPSDLGGDGCHGAT